MVAAIKLELVAAFVGIRTLGPGLPEGLLTSPSQPLSARR
jgi:hypothetical protein